MWNHFARRETKHPEKARENEPWKRVSAWRGREGVLVKQGRLLGEKDKIIVVRTTEIMLTSFTIKVTTIAMIAAAVR